MFVSEQFKLGWLVALLEGEGSFYRGRVQVTTTDEYVAATLVELAGGAYKSTKIHKSNVKQPYRWVLCGETAALLMLKVYQYLGPRRQFQIRDALLLASKCTQRMVTDLIVTELHNREL